MNRGNLFANDLKKLDLSEKVDFLILNWIIEL